MLLERKNNRVSYKPLDRLPEFTLEKMWDLKQIEEARKNMHTTIDHFFDKIKSNYCSHFNDLPSKDKATNIYENLTFSVFNTITSRGIRQDEIQNRFFSCCDAIHLVEI